MPKGIIREYPGGLKVLYGGTRTGVNLSRPWQQPITVDPGKCPFCKGEGDVAETFGNGWMVLNNKFTPHSYHQMIIPPACWPEEELRVLGGESRIREAFAHISQVVERGLASHNELWVNVYVGALAGQNIPHLHYHILAPERFPNGVDPDVVEQGLASIWRKERTFLKHLASSPRVLTWIRSSWGLAAVVESVFRVGQCYIGYFVPHRDEDHEPQVFVPGLGDVASLVHKVVSAYAAAFKSQQGLAPDFQLFLKFNRYGDWLKFSWGSYLPILNHHGSTESVGAIHLGGPFVHPWTPEETLEHLKKFS